MLSVLSQLFVVERHRPRAGAVGFSVPALGEMEVIDEANVEPLLVTNMRGTFVRTRVASGGYVRYGFSECPIDQELDLLKEFFRVLNREGVRYDWSNTTGSIPEAIEKMTQNGLVPKSLVVPFDFKIEEKFKELRIFSLDLPGKALLVAQPQVAGYYTRTGEYVGISAQQVNAAFILVCL